MKPSITGLWFIASKTKGQLNAGLKMQQVQEHQPPARRCTAMAT